MFATFQKLFPRIVVVSHLLPAIFNHIATLWIFSPKGFKSEIPVVVTFWRQVYENRRMIWRNRWKSSDNIIWEGYPVLLVGGYVGQTEDYKDLIRWFPTLLQQNKGATKGGEEDTRDPRDRSLDKAPNRRDTRKEHQQNNEKTNSKTHRREKRTRIERGNKEIERLMEHIEKPKHHRKEKRLQQISLLRTIPYADHQRWWSKETIAVVTGGNRGIGFEICRQLLDHGVTVIMTSRDESVGVESIKVLQEGGFTNVACHQLNILDSSSINEFAEWLKENYGGLDILVNNAAVNFNQGSRNSVENARSVIETNYYGTKKMIEAMLPLMKPSVAGGRIVNVSSRYGRLNSKHNRLENEALREKLNDVESLTEELIDEIVSSFLQQVEDGTWKLGGWPKKLTDYSVSKLAVNAYTRIMAKKLSERPEGEKIYINCYCPGWVKTVLTDYSGTVPIEHGADTAVWLSLLPGQEISGKFFAERREVTF
ncbi:hypothetical protein RJT34_00639 [Clitoria ternatea]|uniref:Uncharacterized protein n=1 Tax=Clitoria ternatea TaxID=43366 RepID=A0AAN9KJG6_CLITE